MAKLCIGFLKRNLLKTPIESKSAQFLDRSSSQYCLQKLPNSDYSVHEVSLYFSSILIVIIVVNWTYRHSQFSIFLLQIPPYTSFSLSLHKYIYIYIHIPCCTFLNVKFLLQKFLNEKKRSNDDNWCVIFPFFFFSLHPLCPLRSDNEKRTWLWEAGM